jgi:hypothetical protein
VHMYAQLLTPLPLYALVSTPSPLNAYVLWMAPYRQNVFENHETSFKIISIQIQVCGSSLSNAAYMYMYNTHENKLHKILYQWNVK